MKTIKKVVKIKSISDIETLPETIEAILLSYDKTARSMESYDDNFRISIRVLFDSEQTDDIELLDTEITLFDPSYGGEVPPLYMITFIYNASSGTPYGNVLYTVQLTDMELSVPTLGIKPVSEKDHHETYVGQNYGLEDFFDTWIARDLEKFVDYVLKQASMSR